MTVDDVRTFEKKMQEETNLKVLSVATEGCDGVADGETTPITTTTKSDEESKEDEDKDGDNFASAKTSPTKETASVPSSPSGDEGAAVANNPVAAAAAGLRSWLNWS